MISFIIPSYNNLKHLKNVYASIQKHAPEAEVILLDDGSTDGTWDWIWELAEAHQHREVKAYRSTERVGHTILYDRGIDYATNEIVGILHADMILGPNYVENMLKHLEPGKVVCATRIEPPLHPQSPEKITYDFGLDPTNFNFELFQKVSEEHKQNKLTDFWFAPFTLHKKVWNEIGGHDTLFRRSREDSDILYRMCLKGIQFKQDWNAIVYHFTCTSSRGKDWWKQENQEKTQLQSFADRIELIRFLKKWGKFKHDTFKNKDDFKYNISVNFKNTKNKEKFILENYFLFNKISIDNKDCYNFLKKEYESQQDPANKLFNISDETWSKLKSSYRVIEFEDIFSLSNINDDVVINFDLNHLNQTTFQYLHNMQNILKDSLYENDTGEFDLENCMFVKVNKLINRLNDNITVNNPPFSLPLEYL